VPLQHSSRWFTIKSRILSYIYNKCEPGICHTTKQGTRYSATIEQSTEISVTHNSWLESRCSPLSIFTELRAGRPETRGSIHSEGKHFSPNGRNRLLSPPSLLSSGYREFCIWGQSG
jgi:hypothetical protein